VTFRNVRGKFAVDGNSWESRVSNRDFAGRNADAVRAASGYFTRNDVARFRPTAAAEFRGTRMVEALEIRVNGNPGGDAGTEQNLGVEQGFDRMLWKLCPLSMTAMKPTPFVIALFIGFATSTAFAANSDHQSLFARLDANTDGQLTKAEIPDEHSSLFRRLVRIGDDDADGKLSLGEFETGLTINRPEKVVTEKVPNELPGADALLLMLAWMDSNGDLSITEREVPANLKPLYDQFVELMNLPNSSRLPVPQLRQQAGRYGMMAQRFANRQNIDVEVELALLTDKQWQYVERLQEPLRPGAMMGNRENAAVAFSQLDTNGDGKVALEELPPPLAERLAGMWERADRDQDRELSEQEFMVVRDRLAALQSGRDVPPKNRQGVKQLLKRADRDGDGKLSRDEAPPRLANRFDNLDQNGDNQLSGDELHAAAENLATLRNSTGKRFQKSPPSGGAAKKPGEK
jgi:Ca2+-binding EF-hand superfamily protein